MSTTSKGVAKKTEKRMFLLQSGKECNASEKNLPLNCAMIISCGALKPDQFFLATG
jgi:hypothetical protein